MFDSKSRESLREDSGYEAWLIRYCADLLAKRRPIWSPTTIVIPDQGPCVLNQATGNHLGESLAADVVNEIMPLILCAGYKIADMVIEWCLRENGMSCRQTTFVKKARLLGNVATWPDFLATETALRDVLVGAYKELRLKRNAIVHGEWGTSQNEELHFDFEYDDPSARGKNRPKIQQTAIVPFAAVLSFAEFLAEVHRLLVASSAFPVQRQSLYRLRQLANDFQTLHGKPAISLPATQFYRVRRLTEGDRVDVEAIRSNLLKRASNVEFELEIVKSGARWVLPESVVRDSRGEILIDESLDSYRIP